MKINGEYTINKIFQMKEMKLHKMRALMLKIKKEGRK